VAIGGVIAFRNIAEVVNK